MFDELLEDDLYFQERDERVAARTANQVLQQAVIELVQVRFPNIIEFAQQKVEHINAPETLHTLIKQVGAALDEATAKWAIHTLAA